MYNMTILPLVAVYSLFCVAEIGQEPEAPTAQIPDGLTVQMKLPEGKTLSHFYAALRMAFPTVESLDPKSRPPKPKPYPHKRLLLQTHKVTSNAKDTQRIVLASDGRVTTSYWRNSFKAENDLPDRWGSSVGMADADWILDVDDFVAAGDVRVRGFKIHVGLADYELRSEKTGNVSPITNVVHVTTENLDPSKPGELVFVLPSGKERTFALSKKQGLFVLADMRPEGSPLVHMEGWEEQSHERR